MKSQPPPLESILETALYVDDLPRARTFYENALGLMPMFADERLVAYDVGGQSVLLLFLRGGSTMPVNLPGRCNPCARRRGAGPLRLCDCRWGPAAVGGPPRKPRHSGHEPRQLVPRRDEPLLRRSGRSCRRVDHPRSMGDPLRLRGRSPRVREALDGAGPAGHVGPCGGPPVTEARASVAIAASARSPATSICRRSPRTRASAWSRPCVSRNAEIDRRLPRSRGSPNDAGRERWSSSPSARRRRRASTRAEALSRRPARASRKAARARR